VGAFLAVREQRPHLLTVGTEHHAVLDTCRFLERLGAEVTVVPVDGEGLVDPEDVRRGTRLRSLHHGGGQERGRRAGTENVAGIVGMSRALELALADRETEAVRQAALRDHLIERIRMLAPDVILNGHPTRRLPNNVNMAFPGIDAEALLLNLDLEGICASAGSACTAGSLEPSHVIRALGRPPALVNGSVRFSLGRGTTKAEIDTVAERLAQIVARLRGKSLVAVGAQRP
jgi:cysteine desulfurase